MELILHLWETFLTFPIVLNNFFNDQENEVVKKRAFIFIGLSGDQILADKRILF